MAKEIKQVVVVEYVRDYEKHVVTANKHVLPNDGDLGKRLRQMLGGDPTDQYDIGGHKKGKRAMSLMKGGAKMLEVFENLRDPDLRQWIGTKHPGYPTKEIEAQAESSDWDVRDAVWRNGDPRVDFDYVEGTGWDQ